MALPARPDTLVRYVDALAGHKAPATIRRYLSSIATFRRAARLDNPCTAIEVSLALSVSTASRVGRRPGPHR